MISLVVNNNYYCGGGGGGEGFFQIVSFLDLCREERSPDFIWKTMSSQDDFERDANSWWKKHFSDSEVCVRVEGETTSMISLAEFRKALRTDPALGSGHNDKEVSVIIKEVIGVFDESENLLVDRKDFCNFVKRYGPLKNIFKRSVQSFIVNGDIVQWFHGRISRNIAQSRLKRAMSWENIKRKEGLFLVRIGNSKPEHFVISVVGKLGFSHKLIYNHGKKGRVKKSDRKTESSCTKEKTCI